LHRGLLLAISLH